MRRVRAGMLLAASLAIAGIAAGRASFSSLIPNATVNLPGNITECQTCHVSQDGGPSWNPFGQQVKDNLTDRRPDWTKIQNLDADGDNYTNGQELGDPGGLWRPGRPNPSAAILTHPGNANSKLPAGIGPITVPRPWAAIKELFR